MLNLLLIVFGKVFSKIIQVFNLGNGSTWPGHIAMKLNSNFIAEILKNSNLKIVIIAGTNGKTTTSRLIKTVLEDNGKYVVHNESGANLLNGIASTLILNTDWKAKLNQDYAIFETDENTLPQVLKEVCPDFVLLLNLFRDQLDRYGEVNTIVKKWKEALAKLPDSTTYILNADDPQIAFLGNQLKGEQYFFGLNNQSGDSVPAFSADSVNCPKCGEKLNFSHIVFSHLGNWGCKKCGLKRPLPDIADFPYFPIPGIYNKYNILASVIVLRKMGLKDNKIEQSFTNFIPAFGRQEKLTYMGKSVQIFLSKNPTGFNQSYLTVKSLGAKIILLVLNDRVPDGRDVSWIWDINVPEIGQFKHVLIAGDRVYEMALRVKYEIEEQNDKRKTQNNSLKFKTFTDLKTAIGEGVKMTGDDETFFILPTYSAMLEVRKILTGKRIL